MVAGIMLGMLVIAFFGIPAIVHAGDPNGADTLKADPDAAVNMAWTLVTGFLVFLMQLGFAFLGAGLLRARNTVNYFTKSYMDFCIGGLAYWAFGFGIMFGGSALWPGLADGNKMFGYSGFFLSGDSYDVKTIMGWFFQMVFAATAATIVAGAVAERMKITAYLAYSFIVTGIIYSVYGHWVWGGGWLATLKVGDMTGAKDFAGSGVVHTVGGLAALVGAWMVGPRLGKFNKDGSPNAIKGHNLPFVVIGTFILFFGWFGFNPGSTLAATDLRISVITVNTFLAGAAGAVVGLYYTFMKTGKADIITACNGSLAGLVAVTAPCAYIAPWAAVVIGGLAPFVMIGTATFVERTLKVDDAVGAVGVHAGGGLFGLLCVGIFADGKYGGITGLIHGHTDQLVLQLIDMGVVAGWTLGTAFLCFWLIKQTIGLRASREEELSGLDVPEHGIEAYPADKPIPALSGAAQ
ncbi:MAG: ammonium transporter [Chloroflexi bacterium]|nr:ammonium transporter [Chloroflexota bacterium]